MKWDHVFFIGPRGCGKTTVAQLFAEWLRVDWADTDREVVLEARMSIREIFEKEGEAGFRRRESECLRNLLNEDVVAIATGGGIVLNKENRDLMCAFGHVVWLTADIDTLWQRIASDPSTSTSRPTLTVGGREEIAQLMEAREPLYRACADHTVNTTGRTPEQVAQSIHVWLDELYNASR